jgi:hypothetical protein
MTTLIGAWKNAEATGVGILMTIMLLYLSIPKKKHFCLTCQ